MTITDPNAAAPASADTAASATPAPAAAAAPSPAPSPNAATPAALPTSGDTTSTPAKDASSAPAPDAKPPANPDPSPSPQPSDYKIPDEYKDKPWAAKIKSEADLYKQLDHLNSAVGKKTIAPDLAKATDAEREEYYAQTRPKELAEYKFGETTDPIISQGMGESLMKNGVSAVQANAIIADYQANEQKLLAAQFSPDGMKEAMKTAFGDDWEKVSGATRNALKTVMSPEDNAMLDNLPNPYIALVYRTMGSVAKAYGVTESGAHTEAGKGNPAPTDITSVRQGLRDSIAALQRRPHTAQEKEVLVGQLRKTYQPTK